MVQLQKSWGWGLVPSDYVTKKTELAPGETLLSGVQRKPKYVYTSNEIAIITNGFAGLLAQTIGVAYHVRAWTENVVRRSSSRK
jgi:hypothetical protein